MQETWVFGYGSLLWNPGFAPAESLGARLADYHRSFCMLSIHHRGSEAEPGLVLALDHAPGTVCDGVAFRLPEADTEAILADLRERELISSAYLEMTLPLDLADGRRIMALAYVVDRSHRQYCRFDLERQARIIAFATGGRGPNVDYLTNTAEHLAGLGIQDPEMDWLVARVKTLRAAGQEAAPDGP